LLELFWVPASIGKPMDINKKFKSPKRNNWQLNLIVLPGLLFLLAFYFVPLFGLIIPFKNINYQKGILGSPWIGMKNFEFFFKSKNALQITRNTLMLNFLFILVTITLSIIVALILFELSRKSVKIFQTAIFMPYFISWIAGSYILYSFLNPSMGLLPNLIEKMGGEVVNYYFEPSYWPIILLLSYLWKNIGYTTLLFYTALLSVDPTLYEAAAIDGANKIQRMTRISIPAISSVIILIFLLQIGKVFFSDFGLFYFMTMDSGALYSVTDVIDTYVYRALRVTGNIGMASAASLYQSVLGFILVLISNYIVKRIDPENGIF
jgi:putative aldouronate transport system permease protein